MATAAVDLNPFRTGSLSLDASTAAAWRQLGSAGTDAEFADFVDRSLSLVEAGASLSTLATHAVVARLPAAAAPTALSAMAAVVADFARCNMSASAMASALEDGGFKAARAGAFSTAVSARLDAIRGALERSGLPLPSVVDLKWRLDYVIASKEGGKVGKPVYLIDLLLADPAAAAGATSASAAATTRRVTFTCTPQELDDLRARVKEAVRAAAGLVPKAA